MSQNTKYDHKTSIKHQSHLSRINNISYMYYILFYAKCLSFAKSVLTDDTIHYIACVSHMILPQFLQFTVRILQSSTEKCHTRIS